MVNKIIYKLLIFISKILPLGYQGVIHKFCTYILSNVLSYRKKVIIANLKLAFPSWSEFRHSQVMKAYYSEMSAYVLETLVLFSKNEAWFKDKIIYHLPPKMRQQMESKSIIVMGSHQGNWEWAAVLFPLFTGLKAHAVYKPLSNKSLDGLVKKSRSRFGLGLLSMKEVVRYMATHAEPAIYFFVADQSPGDVNSGKWFPFLGQETLFLNGAEQLANKYKLPVWVQTIRRTNGSGYEVLFTELDPQAITAGYVQHLEADILREPESWLWSHKRWKHKNLPATTIPSL